MSEGSTYRASPNLALAKYWGKADTERNLPATPSLGITLSGLDTVTTANLADERDSISIDGVAANMDRFAPIFDMIRQRTGNHTYFRIKSRNSFPTAAGLASSSSGFAALVYACADATSSGIGEETISEIARFGSASAARSVFGGFVYLDAGGLHASQLYSSDHWPELRVLLVAVDVREKPISSRKAMKISRDTSPYYADWVESSAMLFQEVKSAVAGRDIAKLGPFVRQSYLRMFGTMFSSTPPIIYWLPASLRIIHECNALRTEGYQAWETMDAGPQVKIICLEREMEHIADRISALDDSWKIYHAKPGPGPSKIDE